MAQKWYIVHVYSGFENKVKTALEERVAASPHKDKFGEVLVPTEEVVELVKGKRRTSSRKFYPGYILVQLDLDDETWHIVNSTAKVTGFLGGRRTNPPLSATRRPTRSSSAWRRESSNRSPSTILNSAMIYVLSTGPSPISTARWKRSTRKKEKSRCWSAFSGVPRRWNSISSR